jgi:hypothetical protein
MKTRIQFSILEKKLLNGDLFFYQRDIHTGSRPPTGALAFLLFWFAVIDLCLWVVLRGNNLVAGNQSPPPPFAIWDYSSSIAEIYEQTKQSQKNVTD